MASEKKLSARLQAYIDACSGPGITLYEGHPAVLMREAADAISCLVVERDEANANVAKLLTAAREDFELMKDTAHTVQSLTARATAAEARVAQLEGEVTDAEIDDAVRCIALGFAAAVADKTNIGAALRRFVAARTALSQSPDRESGT